MRSANNRRPRDVRFPAPGKLRKSAKSTAWSHSGADNDRNHRAAGDDLDFRANAAGGSGALHGGVAMPYNVDTWKTKEIDNLQIPVSSLFKHDRKDWHPKRTNHDDGTVTFSVMDGCNIHGTIDGDWLTVLSIEMYGEGSGTALHWIVEPALADSKGRLVASRVWEGGDFIDKLIVDDGTVSSEAIEI